MGILFNRKRLGRLSDFYKLDQDISILDLKEEGARGTRVTIILFAQLKYMFERKHLSIH
jgi:hypothetical protein